MAPPDEQGELVAPSERVVIVRDLTRHYGHRQALRGLDLDLSRGEFLTIFGPNGAGKTTFLRILAGLVSPSSGRLALFGLDPRREPDAVKRKIGLIAHAGMLYGGLGARENLVLFARLYDLHEPRRRAD